MPTSKPIDQPAKRAKRGRVHGKGWGKLRRWTGISAKPARPSGRNPTDYSAVINA